MNQNMKKIIKVILTISALSIILLISFMLIDYSRAQAGKKPLFARQKSTSVTVFPVKEGFEKSYGIDNEIVEYRGIGYKVTVCNVEDKIHHFTLNKKENVNCFKSLTCTKEFSENDKHKFEYSFLGEKMFRIETTLLIPVEQLENEETYKQEFMKINEIDNCGGTFKKTNETTYETITICNIENITEAEVEKIYSTSKSSLDMTKEEMITSYSQDESMICN